MTMKKIIIAVFLVVILAVSFIIFNTYIYKQKQADSLIATDLKNTEFIIDGERMVLGDNLQYFGNELVIDLNNDGQDDMVFLVTHSPGGSGTFFYVVAALASEVGYVGSDGYFLGDRIAPQTTNLSQNPSHNNVMVVNFADRNPGDSMTALPSLGKSIYLKLDDDNRWGIVEPDFEGEANPLQMTLGMKTWVWQSASYNDGREISPKNTNAFTITFTDDATFSAATDCNSVGGKYTISDQTIIFTDIFSTLMYCENSQEAVFVQLLENTTSFFFTNRGELIFELKYDSGTATFR
jgi:heat shock protein HslJ